MRRSVSFGAPRRRPPRRGRRTAASGTGCEPTPRGFASLFRGLVAAALGLVLALPAAAQPLFRFGPLTGTGELVFSLQEQEKLSFFSRDTLLDRGLSEERLSLRQSLTVVDSKFLTLDYGFTLGLVQSRLATETAEDRGDGKLRSVDLTATLWPVSRRLRLFFNFTDNETPVEFAGTRELATSNFGLNVGIGPGWFPGTVSLRESRLESSSEFGRLVRSVDRRRRALDYSGNNRWQRHELHASYRFEDVDDRVTPTVSHRSHNLNLNHRLEVLAPDLVTLNSLVRYFNRSGDLTSSSLYLDGLLRMRHRRYLESSFRYVAQTLESFSGPDSDSQRAIATLHHRLWESLETEVFAARTETTSPGSRTGRDEAGLDSTYRKKLPGRGQLTARLTSRYELRDNLRGDGQELIVDERHVARFGIPVRLERPAVFPGSVVVTDELRTTIYERGFDYELTVIGDFTEITLIVGGAIRDGQTILVEYRAAAPSASKSEAVLSGFDLGLDYGWVAPFWGIRRADFELVEGLPDRLLDDEEDEYYGVRLRIDRRHVKLISFNELRRRDSELQAFESLRLGQSLILRPARRWTLTLNLARLDTDFTVPLRQSRVDEGRLSLRWTPMPLLSLEAYASHRILSDTEVDDQTYERLGFQGRWIVGKITIVAAIDRWRRERGDGEPLLEESDGMTASLRISRRFFPGRLGTPMRRPDPEPWPADMPGLWSQPGARQPSAGQPGAAETNP